MKVALIIIAVATTYLIGPWILAKAINFFTKWRAAQALARFNPETIICPACAYRGDLRSEGRTMVVRFRRTRGNEKAALECTCLRCGAQPFVPLYKKAEEWLPNITLEELKEQTRQ